MKNLVCFDTETTGLKSSVDEVLQISMVDGDGNALLDTYVKPIAHTSWDDAQKVHGITPEMVQDAPTFAELRGQIQDIIDQADLIVGYNVIFDIGFLRAGGVEVSDEIQVYDVMREFAPIYGEFSEWFGGYKWQKLSTCARYYEYEFKAHDSLEDVKATLYCYYKLIELGD